MTTPAALWTLSAARLGPLLDAGDVRPDDLLDACLQRIAATQPALNAYCHVDAEGARAAAEAARARQRAGRRLGALDGVPVSVKDNLHVAGMPATWGSELYAGFVPPRDDIAVERLRAHGAVIVGKTNTPEFALAGRTDNRLFGLTRNPWDIRLNPGGSSGGAAAAVAAGCCPLALATDAGGSGRLPAAYTGVVGLRPTNGRIPRRHGFPPLAPDFQVIAPMARDVADLRLLLGAVGGADARDPASALAAAAAAQRARDRGGPLRIRVATQVRAGEAEAPVDAQVRAHVEAAAALLAGPDCRVEAGPVPYDLAEVREVWRILASVGVARVLSRAGRWQGRVGDSIAATAEAGARVGAVEYVHALDRLAAIRADVGTAWDGCDLVLTPTSAAPAFPVVQPHPGQIDGRPADLLSMSVFTTWVNACGLPAISVPVAPADDGRPIGLQLVGRPGDDDVLLEVAARLEAAQPWAHRWPPGLA